MSLYVDRKYLSLLSHKLEGYKQKSIDLYNFRCPFCGDSSKKKSKKRGFIYKKNQNLFYRCHNCNAGYSFYNFLTLLDNLLASEYHFEVFKSKYESEEVTYAPFELIETTNNDLNIPSIFELPKNHEALKYVSGRKIPIEKYPDIYYAECYKSFIDELVPNHGKTIIPNDKRIVFPFYDRENKLIAVQGRTITDNSVRFITIKLHEDFDKIYGLNTVDESKDIYVLEGIIDSLFIDNSIATCDSNLSFASKFFPKEKLVLIPDRDVRNIQIMKQVKKYLDEYRVCLLPDDFPGKDINKAIENGLTKSEVYDIIVNNTFSGVRLQLEFSKWKKI